MTTYAATAAESEAAMSEFSTIQAGTLPVGTVTERGTIVATSLTAYLMADGGGFVPFAEIHGQPAPAAILFDGWAL